MLGGIFLYFESLPFCELLKGTGSNLKRFSLFFPRIERTWVEATHTSRIDAHMANQNPFKILGIDANALSDFTDIELSNLVKDCHRTLAKIFHPDLGAKASRERFDAINWARAELDYDTNRRSFTHWRELSAPKRSQKAPEFLGLQERLIRLERLSATLGTVWRTCLETFIKPGSEQFRILPTSEQLESDESRLEFTGASIFDCRPLRITCWTRGEQVEVATDIKGNTVIRELKTRRFDLREEPVPRVPRHHVTFSDVSFRCTVLEQGEVLLDDARMRIIGSLLGNRKTPDELASAMEQTDLYARMALERTGCARLLEAEDIAILFPFFRPIVPPRESPPAGHRTFLGEYSHLVAAKETENNELQFYLMGIPLIIVPRGAG